MFKANVQYLKDITDHNGGLEPNPTSEIDPHLGLGPLITPEVIAKSKFFTSRLNKPKVSR